MIFHHFPASNQQEKKQTEGEGGSQKGQLHVKKRQHKRKEVVGRKGKMEKGKVRENELFSSGGKEKPGERKGAERVGRWLCSLLRKWQQKNRLRRRGEQKERTKRLNNFSKCQKPSRGRRGGGKFVGSGW